MNGIKRLFGKIRELEKEYDAFSDLSHTEINGAQRSINKMLGIDDETFQKYSCKNDAPESPLIDGMQRSINKMLGISDEDFLKFSSK